VRTPALPRSSPGVRVSRGLALSARTCRPGRPSAFACQLRLRTRSLPSGVPESRQSFTLPRSAPAALSLPSGLRQAQSAGRLRESSPALTGWSPAAGPRWW
jgi:hypothetical protein